MTVAAILRHKGTNIVHVAPSVTIAELAGLLSARRIGAALVLDGDGRLLGIVSERDIIRGLSVHGARTLTMTAAQMMTAEVTTVTPRTTLPEALTMMTEGRFRHLPVLEGGRLVGIVSIGDVVKARLMAQEAEMDSLKAYVAGAA